MAEAPIPVISSAELKQLQASEVDFVLVDVRDPEEYAAGHIEGAVNVPFNFIDVDADFVIPNFITKVVVCCESGQRAQAAAAELIFLGYQDVVSLLD